MDRILGAIDSLTRWGATGWAWLPEDSSQSIEIEAVLDGRIIGRAMTDQVRPDLKEKGKERCGFVLTFAEPVTSSSIPLLRAYCPQASIALHGDQWSDVAGYVDMVDQAHAVGWAWMPGAPDRALQVEAVLDGRIVGRATADQMRADLAASGRGSGRYGFTLEFDAPLAGDTIPEFRVSQADGLTTLRSTRVVTPAQEPSPADGTEEPTASSLNIEGAVDSLTRWGATGWAWSPDDPDGLVEVEAVLDGRVIGRTRADQTRPDLKGKGKGRCGFVLTFAEAVTSDSIPLLRAHDSQGSVRLSGDQWSSVAGYVDVVAHWGAVGWAWMPGAPDRAVEVEAVLDSKVIGRATADQMRADLAASGRGSGRYGFTLRFEAPLMDDTVPDFRVLQADGVTTLRGTRIITPVQEPSPARKTKEPTTSSLNVEGAVDSLTRWSVTGWAWLPDDPDRSVEVEAVLDGRVIGRTLADQMRPDLKGKGKERCGFVLAFTEPTISTDVVPLVRVMGPEGPTLLAYGAPRLSPPAPSRDEGLRTTIEGAIDRLSGSEAIGWAWMPDAPERAVEIEAILNGRIIGRTLAEQMRSDLKEHNKGTGLYGFHLSFEVRITPTSLPAINALGPQGPTRLPLPAFSQTQTDAAQADTIVLSRSTRVSSDIPGSEGHIDLLTRWFAAGWAWLPHAPDQAVQVEAVLQGTVIGRTTADQMRSDLAEHGKGTGRYGFKLQFNAPLLSDEIPTFRTLAATENSLPGAFRLPPITPTESKARPPANTQTLIDEHATFTSRGPNFEDFDPNIQLKVKAHFGSPNSPLLVAFYLPQFHPIPENDRFWGAGFTEWRQLARGLSRFPGHYQPRIPRDFGFYNLLDEEVLKIQATMAKSHGIGGFAYYYYWFNRRRVLERPLDGHLNSDVDMPFMLIWANENWTRTWDGAESDVLLKQDYRMEDEGALVDDLVRHFADRRYIRLRGRPLFVIYNPKNVPDSATTFDRWRQKITARLGVAPLIFMAQTFGEEDPRKHGLDGAIEFPPHKLSNHLPGRPTPDAYSAAFAGRVIDYDDFVEASLNEDEHNEYNLIKTAVPSWDNDCRRPNRGLTLEGIAPAKYQKWLAELISRAIEAPIEGTPVVAINAWNEWAESAYLEPDVHFGAAFLNATGRAYSSAMEAHLGRETRRAADVGHPPQVTVILPNYNHARFLPERIQSVLDQTVPPDEILFLDDCSSDDSVEIARDILRQSTIPYRIVVNEQNSGGVFRQWMKGLSLAKHELIWVAETDDSADRRFLSNLLPAFLREDVMAAFGRITCVNPDGTRRDDLDGYFDGMADFSWQHSSVVPAFKAFSNDFSIKNVIPNASGLVFRKPVLTEDERGRLFEYRFAGDWYFYSLVVRGGSIAYCRSARSFFRVNATSASRSSFFTDRHLAEHLMVVEDLGAQYGIGEAAARAHSDALARYLPDRDPAELRREFLVRVGNAAKPAAMRFCIAANGFTIGGGEILPIDLANVLKARGFHITYLVVERPKTARDNAVRGRLRSDIPVVYWDDVCDNIEGFVSAYGIQLINSHNVSVDYRMFLRGLELNVPYVASLHGGFETVRELLTENFIDFLSRSVSRWLYLSEKNLDFLPERLRDPSKQAHSFNAVAPYVGEWVDRRAFREAHAIAEDAFVFVLCSRAIESKGWRTAIEVVKGLSNNLGRPTHLVLIGDGPIEAGLRAEYAGLSSVTFLGQVDRPIRYFPCFDMGLFPSVFEGETFPLFLLECFETGRPVFATDIGEIPRMMQAAQGSSPGDVVDHRLPLGVLRAALADKIHAMLTTSGVYETYSERAYAASRRFSMDALSDFYCGIFAACLQPAVYEGVSTRSGTEVESHPGM